MAVNPDADKPDVVLRTMRKKRKAIAKRLAQRVSSIQRGIEARGKQRLETLTPATWEMLKQQ